MGTYQNHQPFDLSYLHSITQGDFAFERDLLQLVIRDVDDGIENLQFAWHHNDLVEIGKITKGLKSLIALTGLQDLSAQMMVIEHQLQLGIFRTNSEELLSEILAGWNAVRPALNRALASYR